MSESTQTRKKKLLVLEAERLNEFNDLMGKDSEIFLRKMTDGTGESLSLIFAKKCIDNVDDFCDKNYTSNRRTRVEWQENIFKMWNSTDLRHKIHRPEVGAIAVFAYLKQDKIIGSGQYGIITKVNEDDSFETIEGNMVNSFEEVSRSSQSFGINKRHRTNKKGIRMTLLGYVRPWL